MPFRCLVLLVSASMAYSQIADSAPGEVAGIPVNYTEAKAGVYSLPDPLKLANGQRVKDARTWTEKRRPEIRKLIEENWFGRSPGRPQQMSFDVFEKGTPAFDGKATRRQVTIYFTGDRTGPPHGVAHLPAHRRARSGAGVPQHELCGEQPGGGRSGGQGREAMGP